MRLRSLGCPIRMKKGEAGPIIDSQFLGIGHDDTVWGRDSDLVAKGGILGKRESDDCRQVKGDKAQDG